MLKRNNRITYDSTTYKMYESFKNRLDRCEKTRIILLISNYVLLFNIFLPLAIIYWIFPYGLYIAGIALILKLLVWLPYKKNWNKNVMTLQTIWGWDDYGADIVYKLDSDIDVAEILKFNFLENRTVSTYKLKHKLKTNLHGFDIIASEFILTYKRLKRERSLLYIAGTYLKFYAIDRTFPDFSFRKSSFFSDQDKKPYEILDYIDTASSYSGLDKLDDQQLMLIKNFINKYDPGFFINANSNEMTIILDGQFVNLTPSLNKSLNRESFKNTLINFEKILDFVQSISDIN